MNQTVARRPHSASCQATTVEPPRRCADDGECLADTLPELGDVGSDPDAEGDDTEGEDAERDLGDGLVPEKPREVEARRVREHVEARQDALRRGKSAATRTSTIASTRLELTSVVYVDPLIARCAIVGE